MLLSAKCIILQRRFPFTEWSPEDELEGRYHDLQIRIAVELYNKQGAEGETAHSENGVSRSYESASVSESQLSEIIPKAKVLK
jgi:hypothetical protein